MQRAVKYLVWFIFAFITMLAVKFTDPWYVELAITFAAALVAVRISERLDPADEDD
ncbi:MAG TPA: hypothetical protein VG502_13605 [Flexivirga sp.]|uniref:hypothetical protein n=1 Tax=Flexivirga sp. TaxID=1962927 RepID=UPI002C31DB2B|nr:hypothetical protein [Flexivirga sp.]HWC23329.1 hypothetical protein [Flexivirga sp.]